MTCFGYWRLPKPWTVPRAHAFAVLVKESVEGAIVSNSTVYPDAGHHGCVYWQTADFLIDQGLASHTADGGGYRSTRIFLTPKGERLRDELGPHDQPKETST